MTTIRMALIGCGRRSPAWLRTLQLVEGVELVALCDPLEPRLRDRLSLVNDKAKVACFTDHRKLIRELDFDAAAIVTEPEYQASLSIEFMNAGKDVISEVPVTSTSATSRSVTTRITTIRAHPRSGPSP